MVDPVIDEHFRRSLGADYMNLFGKGVDPLKSASSLTAAAAIAAANINKLPQLSPPVQSATKTTNRRTKDAHQSDDNGSSNSNGDNNDKGTAEDVEMSVDDHFAKALGATWKQLQQNKSAASPTMETEQQDAEMDELEIDTDSDTDNDSNAKDDRSQPSPKDEVTSGNNSKSQCHR